jgi:DNA-directed RNA polymerase specialized sigma24 family protein
MSNVAVVSAFTDLTGARPPASARASRMMFLYFAAGSRIICASNAVVVSASAFCKTSNVRRVPAMDRLREDELLQHIQRLFTAGREDQGWQMLRRLLMPCILGELKARLYDSSFSVEDQEDMLAEIYLRVYRKFPRFELPEHGAFLAFRKYTQLVVRSVTASAYGTRFKGVNPASIEELQQAGREVEDRRSGDFRRTWHRRKLLNTLFYLASQNSAPASTRETKLLLRWLFIDGLSYREIAARLEIKEDALRQRVSFYVRKMRDIYVQMQDGSTGVPVED